MYSWSILHYWLKRTNLFLYLLRVSIHIIYMVDGCTGRGHVWKYWHEADKISTTRTLLRWWLVNIKSPINKNILHTKWFTTSHMQILLMCWVFSAFTVCDLNGKDNLRTFSGSRPHKFWKQFAYMMPICCILARIYAVRPKKILIHKTIECMLETTTNGDRKSTQTLWLRSHAPMINMFNSHKCEINDGCSGYSGRVLELQPRVLSSKLKNAFKLTRGNCKKTMWLPLYICKCITSVWMTPLGHYILL